MDSTQIAVMGGVIAYVLTFAYSIYMAVLNYKQAKVKEILLETNEILKRIEKKQAAPTENALRHFYKSKLLLYKGILYESRIHTKRLNSNCPSDFEKISSVVRLPIW